MKLRELELEDREGVNRLLGGVGFKTRSEAGWAWLYRDNPYRGELAMGWVLEDASGIQGFLGNLPLPVWLEGERGLVASCESYVVSESARGDSTGLIRAWLRQKGPLAFTSTTANAESAPIYKMFKAQPVEARSAQQGLAWVAGNRAAVGTLLHRSGRGGWSGWAPLAAPAARVARALSGRARAPRVDTSAVERGQELPADLDALDARQGALGGLRAVRDRAALSWILADPDRPSGTRVLALREGGELLGLAVLGRHERASGPEARFLELVLLPGAEARAAELLGASVEAARELGAGLLYLRPASEQLHRLFEPLGAEVQGMEHRPCWLRAAKKARTASLIEGWALSPLDGDAPFCLSRAPR